MESWQRGTEEQRYSNRYKILQVTLHGRHIPSSLNRFEKIFDEEAWIVLGPFL